jgi:hypothetical protein
LSHGLLKVERGHLGGVTIEIGRTDKFDVVHTCVF